MELLCVRENGKGQTVPQTLHEPADQQSCHLFLLSENHQQQQVRETQNPATVFLKSKGRSEDQKGFIINNKL